MPRTRRSKAGSIAPWSILARARRCGVRSQSSKSGRICWMFRWTSTVRKWKSRSWTSCGTKRSFRQRKRCRSKSGATSKRPAVCFNGQVYLRGEAGGLSFVARHDFAQHPGQFVDLVGLGNDAAKAVLLKFRHDRVVGIAAGDNRPGLRIELQQPLDRFLAAHAPGNRQVHDDHAERLAALGGVAITPDRLGAIARQFRFIAEPFEHD